MPWTRASSPLQILGCMGIGSRNSREISQMTSFLPHLRVFAHRTFKWVVKTSCRGTRPDCAYSRQSWSREAQEAAHLLADRELLLRGENDSPMLPRGSDAVRLNPAEIRNVERVKDAIVCRCESQMVLIRVPYQIGFSSGDRFDSTRAQRRDQIAVHRVLVQIESDSTHGCDQRGCSFARASPARSSASISASTSSWLA